MNVTELYNMIGKEKEILNTTAPVNHNNQHKK